MMQRPPTGVRPSSSNGERHLPGRKVENWVYVTGMPRSGTTFLGRLLSMPMSVDYIHEPFNPDCGLPDADVLLPYVTEGGELEDRYNAMIESLLRYEGRLRTAYYHRDTPARRMVKWVLGSRGPFYLRLARLNVLRRAAVVKDPTGCLLTGYMTRRHGFRSIILVRHPVAVAASFQRLGWDARSHLLALAEQRDFSRDHPDHPSKEEVGDLTPLEAAAVLWRVVNRALLSQAACDERIRLLRHEEVSEQPVAVVAALYRDLGLPWSERVRAAVVRQTADENPAEAPGSRVQHFRRASSQLLLLRVSQLDPDSRRRVLDLTRDVALQLYDEASFDA